jgi:hypothetical protein
LQDGVKDKWDWSLDPGKGYSVRGAYNLLSSVVQNDRLIYYDYVWNNATSFEGLIASVEAPIKSPTKQRRYSACFRPFLEWLWSLEKRHHLFVGCSFYGNMFVGGYSPSVRYFYGGEVNYFLLFSTIYKFILRFLKNSICTPCDLDDVVNGVVWKSCKS